MLKYVLSPIEINGVTIPNRVVRTAHMTNFGRGTVNEDLIAYHESRAKGGVGLSIIEVLGIHPSSPTTLNVFHPDLKSGYERLVRKCKPHGMKLFQQLWHGGHNAFPLDGNPPWSASCVPSPVYDIVPIEMTKDQIKETVAAYAEAARLCEECGLDGVEVHGAHGYLIQQFMSPLTNKRKDEYGGDFDNRIRFTLEVLDAIRTVVDKEFAVGIRLSPEETIGGLTPEDNARIAKLLEEKGLVDYISVSMGGYYAFPKMIGGMHEPMGYELPTSEPITFSVEKIPRLVTGRIRTLEEADQIIRSGITDLVGMTRAHIADPDIVRKTLKGQIEEIRPCIACNQGCVGELLGPANRMGCTVNPSVGFEVDIGEDKLASSQQKKSILMVGGGPAGMEAARISALRGHRVTLAEARPQLGDMINLAKLAPRHVTIGDITDWQEREVYRLGVEVKTSTYVEAEDIRNEAPDVVIIATGSTPRMDGIQSARPGIPATGIKQSHVTSTIDLFTSPSRNFGATALIVDDVGHYEAIAAAEFLIKKDLEVTFLTRHNAFAHLMETALIAEPALQRLYKGKFKLMTRAHLLEIAEREVTVEFLDGGSKQILPAETVVLVSRNMPDNQLYRDLSGYEGELFIIGDANSPRFLKNAISEGFHVGSTI